jgi:hypothetical protein
VAVIAHVIPIHLARRLRIAGFLFGQGTSVAQANLIATVMAPALLARYTTVGNF